MKFKDITLIDSNYTLFLFALLYPEKINEALFIVSDGVSSHLRKQLKHCIYLKDRKYLKFKNTKEKLRNIKYILSPKFIKLRSENNIYFYGQDHAWFSFLGRNKPFILLEDGLDNYIRHPSVGIKRKLLSYLGFPYKEMGRAENIKKIILTGILPIPNEIQYKTEIIALRDKWEQLDDKNKNFIINLFISPKEKDLIHSLSHRQSALILTQPLNQDQIISETKKLELYNNSIQSLHISEVYVKKHPRDTSNYSKYGWKELGFNETPIELLILLGLDFKKVITYNSTAIFRFTEENRIIIKNSL
ncbi:glycosyltransferase family 52 [Vibrio plantisponsor]|uniref:Glycosyltransferase family 52 n=1 Tax=Vibrio plantisponsor TaxID=664643 RepID=A0ABU4ILX7_9VIBR|nr:glycosyltransferase family 52 [Vibrio plantisponsor]MDW6018299.1 glycosyltransferase family 52 [Vibrio plantisponsor]NNM42475.1 hypothetical protein [Vibrio plantisponsor]